MGNGIPANGKAQDPANVYNKATDRLEDIVSNIWNSREDLFQRLFGSRVDVDKECSYPDTISAQFYRALYDRTGIAERVCTLMPKECFQVCPQIYEDEKSKNTTEFEDALGDIGKSLATTKSWYEDQDNTRLWSYMLRADILSGIGVFGIVLIGLDDGQLLETPAEGAPRDGQPKDITGVAQDIYGGQLPSPPSMRDQYPLASLSGTDAQYWQSYFAPMMSGKKRKNGQRAKMTYLRVFDESLIQVVQYESSIFSPRFGQPIMYRVTLNDPRQPHTGIGLPLATVRVHWSRVVHIAENETVNSEIFAKPRQRPVVNNILDLRKLYGGSAEMYWQGAFPGLSIETVPQLGGDVVIDKEGIRDMMRDYSSRLQRWITLMGMSAKSLSPQVVDPSPQIATQIEAICIEMGCPIRVFKGSERGELASSQDDAAWNDRLKHRQQTYLSPRLIAPFIDRLILLGVLPEPDGYTIHWPDLDSNTDKDRAGIALSMTQAMAAFVSGNVESICPQLDWYTRVAGWDEEEAQAVIDSAHKATEAKLDQHGDLDDAAGEQGLQKTPPPGFEKKPDPPPAMVGADGKPLPPNTVPAPGVTPGLSPAQHVKMAQGGQPPVQAKGQPPPQAPGSSKPAQVNAPKPGAGAQAKSNAGNPGKPPATNMEEDVVEDPLIEDIVVNRRTTKDVLADIQKVADRLNDGMGYGKAYYNEETGEVWVSCWDGDEDAERYDVMENIEGVSSVRIEAESSPNGPDWLSAKTGKALDPKSAADYYEAIDNANPEGHNQYTKTSATLEAGNEVSGHAYNLGRQAIRTGDKDLHLQAAEAHTKAASVRSEMAEVSKGRIKEAHERRAEAHINSAKRHEGASKDSGGTENVNRDEKGRFSAGTSGDVALKDAAKQAKLMAGYKKTGSWAMGERASTAALDLSKRAIKGDTPELHESAAALHKIASEEHGKAFDRMHQVSDIGHTGAGQGGQTERMKHRTAQIMHDKVANEHLHQSAKLRSTHNVFCATGKGGGVDASCSPDQSKAGGESGSHNGPTAKDFQAEPSSPPPPGKAYMPNVEHDHNRDGITDMARVGVPAMSVPPPPKIGRLPNLTPHERRAEQDFASKYEADPEGVAAKFLQMTKAVAAEKGGPPEFGTDDAKRLSKDWLNPRLTQEQQAYNRATLNLALHQTGNAIAKRAFMQHLDTLKEGDEVMVTVGGCGSGKGFSLGNVPEVLKLKNDSKAVWDSAGDQNATENPWIQQEADKRGLRVTYAYVHADPEVQWAHPERGVVKRAEDPKDGRMVDHQVFADSYVLGARNHQAFYDRYKDHPSANFVFLHNGQKIDGIPEEAHGHDRNKLATFAARTVINGNAHPRIKRGALQGFRVWQHQSYGE